MRFIKSPSRKSAAAIGLAVFSCLGSRPAWAQTQTSTWNGIADQTWENPLNWTLPGVPNNTTNGFTDYNVAIGAPSPTVLNSSVTIDSMTLGASGILDTAGNTFLTLNGPTLNLQGTLTVNSNQAFNVTSLILNNVNVSGNGTINLNDDATNTTATVDGTLTLHSTISGQGAVNAALTNFGMVDSTLPGHNIFLQTSDKINNGTFEASGGGTLSATGINITQGTSGQIYTTTSSAAILDGVGVTGGSFGGSGLIQIQGAGNSLTNLSNDADVNVTGNQSLVINGNLTNTFSLTINSDQAYAVTGISFSGGIYTGSGDIVLNNDATNTTATVDGTLTLAAGSIIGEGSVNAALTNNGTVDADVLGHTIYMQTSDKINNNLFEATNGGTLNFESINVSQSSSGKISAISSTGVVNQINLTSTAVTGGAVNISGGSILQMSSSSVTGGTVTISSGSTLNVLAGPSSLNGLTNNGAVNILGGGVLSIIGNLPDTGTVTVNSDQIYAPTSIAFNGGTLSGTGAIVLNDDATVTTATIDGTLIQSAGHSISGQGAINAALTNYGTVNANSTGHFITLQTSDKINNNLFEATSGGTLFATGINITQGTSGQISANTNSFVSLQNVALTGGALNGAGIITIQAGINSLTNLNNAATLDVAGNQSLVINGSLSNSGLITINSDQLFAVTNISFTGGTLFGTGTLALNDDATNTTATVDGTLIQSVGHTINGQGAINAILTNNGTVNANVSGHAIILQTSNKTNNNLFEATAGGTLALASINVTQGTAGQITASGANSLITLSDSNITGGLVSTATGGTLQFTDAASSIAGNITNNGNVSVQGGSVSAPVITGAITGNGALTIGVSNYLRLAPKSVASTFSSVTFSSNSTLDITSNRVLINFASPAADPVASIVTALSTGYTGGSWSGAGILSTTAATGSPGRTLSVGYTDGNTDTGSIAAHNQLIVKYTLAGDTNLDGLVNFGDLVAVLQNFNKGNTDWAHGNFGYGASTNFGDLVTVLQNYNKVLTPAATSSDQLGNTTLPLSTSAQIQNTVVLVPEPTAISLLVLTATGLLKRRRAARRR